MLLVEIMAKLQIAMHELTNDKKYNRRAAQNLLRHQHLTKNSTISA